MPPDHLQPSADDLSSIFPFHLTVSARLEIVQFGAGLGRLFPHLAAGNRLEDHFLILRPKLLPGRFPSIEGHRNTTFELKAKSTSFRLFGPLIYAGQPDTWLLLASPRLSDIDELRAMAPPEAKSFADAKSRLELQAQELLQRNEELTQALEGMAASELKNRFIANLSHEMRTPISGVIGLTELVLDSQLTSDQRDNLDAVKTSAESLLVLLNDILDFSKVEAGKLDIDTLPFSLRRTLQAVLKLLNVRSARKAVELSLSVAEEIPDCLEGDAGRLRQILTNLVGNAIKFTERGSITVAVDSETRAADQVLARFSITDTGIGIPPDKLALIFQPFRQADDSISRKYGGTGLGLSISSRLVELMGGSLEVSSQPGRGSTFSFTLPLRIDAPAGDPVLNASAPPCDTSAISIAGLKILLAEDHLVNQRVAVHLLEKQGCSVTAVATGVEALKALANDHFDLVLMDVQMPEMDGLAATAAIRAAEQGGSKHLPIVAMTAHALKGDRARFLASGMDGYVSKPIRSPDLLEAMRSALCPTDTQGRIV
ncbi:MAG: putative ATPase [Bryobacterales bacterium]|nr:putative ATPase [Bryobacterales bacterium]